MVGKCNKILSSEQKILAVLIFFCSIGGAVLELLGVYVIAPFSDILLNSQEAMLKEDYKLFIQVFNLNTPEQLIVFISLFIILIYIIKNFYFVFLAWVRAKFAAKIERELSVQMLHSYLAKGYSFFVNTNTGALLRGIQFDVSNVYTLLFNFVKLITDVLSTVLLAIYMIWVDWQLAIGLGIIAILCFGVMGRKFAQISIRAGEKTRHYQGKSNQNLLQGIEGAKEILVLKKEKFFVDEYRKNKTLFLEANLKKAICAEIPAYIIEAFCVTGIFGIIALRITIGGIDSNLLMVLASFVVAAFRILPSLGKITTEYTNIVFCIPSLDSIYEYVGSCEDTVFKTGSIEELQRKNDESFEKVKLENITFSYGPELAPVIKNLCLTIEKGQSIAFIGPSGSGKTTLSDILLGLLKPQAGGVYVDGQNIKDIPTKWSSLVGYVSQTMYLADESIRFNIAYGVPINEIDDERVWECLRKARLDDYVRKLENGLDTLVGERGVRFSGGQRQRIAIARALYHKPEIMVLDEATSALDNDTEKAVMESIENLRGTMTLVIIAHRLTTVEKCDYIFEIKDGIAIEKNKEEVLG